MTLQQVPLDSRWRKSSRSSQAADCVEAAVVSPGVVGIRDTKRREGGMLALPANGWSAFLATVTTNLD